MRKLRCVCAAALCGALLVTVRPLNAAEVRSYQVTGPVLELTATTIVVQKGKDRWELARDAARQIATAAAQQLQTLTRTSWLRAVSAAVAVGLVAFVTGGALGLAWGGGSALRTIAAADAAVRWVAAHEGLALGQVRRAVQGDGIWPNARPIRRRVGVQSLPRRWVVEPGTFWVDLAGGGGSGDGRRMTNRCRAGARRAATRRRRRCSCPRG